MSFDRLVEDAVRLAGVRRPNDTKISLSHPLLNGVPYSVFRRNVTVEQRREIGAFFSSAPTADAVSSKLIAVLPEQALILDPTCGIGDLLLSYAGRLPLEPTLAETLAVWGERIAGFDIRPDLIRLCKARLCLLARARGEFADDVDLEDTFPLIQTTDMFDSTADDLLRRADGILFNPPFGKTRWGTNLSWSSGEINAAAIFLDRLTSAVKPNVPISAVLPEVLRCGARYSRFRTLLSARGYSGSFEVRGQFDRWTDVDVFTTLLTRSEEPSVLWQDLSDSSGPAVGDHFDVRVGTVVPHRDPEDAEPQIYICAKTTPAWHREFLPIARRAFAGTSFRPPFVAIRRTSSPSDKMRAVGTIVIGDQPVLVENHLLVVLPKDPSIQACRQMLDMLQAPGTSEQLNAQMRCRHLTTGIIKALRWTEAE